MLALVLALLVVGCRGEEGHAHAEPPHHLLTEKFDGNADGVLDHDEVALLWGALRLPLENHKDHGDDHRDEHGEHGEHIDAGHGDHHDEHTAPHEDEGDHHDEHTAPHADEGDHHDDDEKCLRGPDALMRYVKYGAEHQNNASLDVESFKVAVGSEEVNLTEPIHKLLGRLVLELVTEGCNSTEEHEHHEDGHKHELHGSHEGHGDHGDHGHDDGHEGDHGNEAPWEVVMERFDSNGNRHLEYFEVVRLWQSLGFVKGEPADSHGHLGHAHGRRAGRTLEEEEECLGAEGMTRLVAFGDAHSGEAEEASLGVEKVAVLLEHLLLEKTNAKCNATEATSPSSACSGPSKDKVWGYSMLAVLTLSVLSAVLVVMVPLLALHHLVMEFLLSLAVGALLGDTFYHLLPIILGRHHVEQGHSEPITQWDIRTRVTVALLTVLAFYWIDYVTRLVLGGHGLHDHVESETETESPQNRTTCDIENGHAPDSDCRLQSAVEGLATSPDVEKDAKKETKKKPKWNEWVPLRQVKTLAWVCVISDGFHNFTDGLAIGASFHKSTSLGVATSTAIAFHEIPQEVGDFALMLKAGMSPLQAVLFNFLSAAISMLGAVISCAIGGSEEAENYILSVTIGSFIYLAIGVVVPELLEMKKSTKQNWHRLGAQTVGMVVGGLLLWVIAHTEREHECEHA